MYVAEGLEAVKMRAYVTAGDASALGDFLIRWSSFSKHPPIMVARQGSVRNVLHPRMCMCMREREAKSEHDTPKTYHARTKKGKN